MKGLSPGRRVQRRRGRPSARAGARIHEPKRGAADAARAATVGVMFRGGGGGG